MIRSTATVLSALAILTLSATAVIAAPPAQSAGGEPAMGRADLLARLVACRTMADTSARLACYDVAAAALDAAERQGDVVVVDRNQISTARRENFGFSLPSLPNLFRSATGRPNQ